MLRLLNGTYLAIVNGKHVTLKFLGNNRCEVFINGNYKGIGLFEYIKKQINFLEKLEPQTRIEYIEDSVLFQELNGKKVDVKI
ncbi:hypothetical protein [Thalassobacillus devorans]|uniref:hypothetical protein n=1 Tax=Thalassobacillus devorans TaxID=279813 RepID=UPI00048D636D|nr:hypothetical protein [Thalassobacillus devorans]